ncbi:MAG TPA: hypothetical protein DDW65_23510 [Firmicutes bacterium]|nr:hypothetical protein [Bacillota bacterium]
MKRDKFLILLVNICWVFLIVISFLLLIGAIGKISEGKQIDKIITDLLYCLLYLWNRGMYCVAFLGGIQILLMLRRNQAIIKK